MVGVGGGVPGTKDVRLGDVVVSQPSNGNGGVIQYDFGTYIPGRFKTKGLLNAPPQPLLQALTNLQARHLREGNNLSTHLDVIESHTEFTRPNPKSDILFKSTYDHLEGEQTCGKCEQSQRVDRQSRKNNHVVIHYGTIASGNCVMKDARERDSVSSDLDGVLCFEMEAAGLMNYWPCLVIRGICDYADSHKNKEWQPYAAGVAAAFAKELLVGMAPAAVGKTASIEAMVDELRRASSLEPIPAAPRTSNPGANDGDYQRTAILAALSLASAVAQFLDLGAKVFPSSKDIEDEEATVTNTRLRQLAHEVSRVRSNLANLLKTCSRQQLSREEQGLYDLASQNRQVADELISCLNTLVSGSDSSAFWESIWTAMHTISQKDRMENIAQRLGQYRSQLSLRLRLVLNSSNSLHGAKLGGLENSSKEIVDVISVNYRNVTAGMDRLNAETIAAIFTTRDGSTSSIVADNGSKCMGGGQSSENPTAYSYGLENFITRTGINHIKIILDALHFRGITERRGTISPAHNNTFQWVWTESNKGEQVPWHNLNEWLVHGSGCYWLSGKAGSGKSSLMNYLQDSARTQVSLKRWAGTSQLIIGSFYFWYAGRDLQKSQTGLLRSLLFDVLRPRPDLCVSLFPDICRSILSGRTQGQALDITHVEVMSGFCRLISLVPKDIKIFFFVDGLDEYSGNRNDICDLFSQAASSPSIKILVSSRPIPVCVEKFSRGPMLQLQDLTWNDIHKFTRDTLTSNRVLQDMERAEPGVTTRLVNDVTSKACGVFLWVVLVVRRLILCLQNYDSMAELKKEIERLPSDLENLYDHMLGDQSEQHQLLGSKYLLLALRAMEMGIDLHLLQLSFAERDDYTQSLQDPIRELTAEVEEWICKAAEGRLRSRCCGLIETQLVQNGQSLTKSDKKVAFFHRTVVEFLQLQNTWNKLQSLTLKSLFNAENALVSSALAEVKAARLRDCLPCSGVHTPLLWRLFRMINFEPNLGDYARQEFHNRYLPEFKRVVQFHWHDPTIFVSPDEEFEAVSASALRANTQLKLIYPKSFIFSCLICTPVHDLLEKYLDRYQITPAHMLMHFVDETDPRIRRSMVRHILLRESPSYCPMARENIDPAFLNSWSGRWKGISGNVLELSSISLWRYLLHYIFAVVDSPQRPEARATMSSSEMMMTLLDVILVMMHAEEGLVRPDISITVMRSNKSEKISDVGLVAELLWKFWAKLVSFQATSNPETLVNIADRSCVLEDLLIRHTTHSAIYWSIMDELARARKPHTPQIPSGSEKRSERKSSFFRIWRKGKASASKDAQWSPERKHNSPASLYTESPWRRYKERG